MAGEPEDAIESALFIEVAMPSLDLPVAADVTGPPAVDLLLATRVDIALSDGRRVLIEGLTSLLAVIGLVQGLSV